MAAVIEDAHRRQRRRRIATAVVIVIACAATAIALAVVPSNGRGRSAAARPGQQVKQVWLRPDGHLVAVGQNGAVWLRVCVPSRTVTGASFSPIGRFVVITGPALTRARGGSGTTIRLAGTLPHCRA
jgi:hypothetical protein